MGTYCDSLIADLFLYCYELKFMENSKKKTF
jgi:hypothetical protein